MTQPSAGRFLGMAACILAASAAWAQKAPASRQQQPAVDKAASYYHFALAHLYSELAGVYGNRGEYLNKAIENYRLAIKADPGAGFLSEELSDLYIQSGQIRAAVTEAEDALSRNPEDLTARRILGRIYTRMIGDANQNRVDENMLKKAIEQYQKIVEKQPGDTDVWLMLGRLHKIAQNSVESEKAYKKVLEADADNEDALTGLAMVYADLGDSQRATEMLSKVAAKNPNLRTLTALAGTYEQMRDYALAAETLKRAVALAPDNPEIKRALAQNLLLSEQLDESLKIYEQLAAEDPKDYRSHLRRSQIYRQKRDFAKAREANRKARELDPDNLEIRFNEVNLLEAEGHIPQAIKLLKEMLDSTAKKVYGAAERGNRLALLERLGMLYRAGDQPQRAVETFRQMAEVDPDIAPRAAAQVIEAYRAAKDLKKAEQEADEAARKYPDDRTVRSVRASLLADLGRAGEAAAEVRKLLDGKNDRETWLSLAQIHEKGKDYAAMAKAIDEAEKLSSARDEKESIHFMRGAMFEKMKKYDEAEAEFRKVLEINPENASALNYLGYMFADRNVRLQEAYQMIRRAVDREPNNGAFLDSLGWVYYRLANYAEAEKALLLAITRYARDPTIYDHLGDVYFKQGRVREAVVQWQKSLQEWEASPPSEADPVETARIQKKVESAKVRLAKESSATKQQRQ